MQGLPFTVNLKPRHPPAFCGRIEEDVVTWLMQVRNFLSLTICSEEQQVAYMSTLLQEAAIDWWVTLLREQRGKRPGTFEEFATLLEQHFGSSNRVIRARAALRVLEQDRTEGVRSYSTRFAELLGKLPSYDEEWTKSQFVWGLHREIAEMVVITAPDDLATAMQIAEQVELATNSAKQSEYMRRLSTKGASEVTLEAPTITRYASMQCHRCTGFGHWAYQCPSQYRQRGRRGAHRGRNRHSTRTAAVDRKLVANTALAQSESEVFWGVLQQTPNTSPVSRGGLSGN